MILKPRLFSCYNTKNERTNVYWIHHTISRRFVKRVDRSTGAPHIRRRRCTDYQRKQKRNGPCSFIPTPAGGLTTICAGNVFIHASRATGRWSSNVQDFMQNGPPEEMKNPHQFHNKPHPGTGVVLLHSVRIFAAPAPFKTRYPHHILDKSPTKEGHLMIDTKPWWKGYKYSHIKKSEIRKHLSACQAALWLSS